MPIRFACPHCQRAYRVADRFAGATMRCKQCENQVTVPAAEGNGKSTPKKPDPAPPSPAVEESYEPAISFGSRFQEDTELDMTPMVDVTFLLLIFFMVTASFSLQKSIQVPPPENPEAASASPQMEEEEEDDFIIVKIYADNSIWVGDSQAPSWHSLLDKIGQERSQDVQSGAGARNRMLILASDDAHHETVVRALDAATAAGLEGAQVSTLEEEDF